MGISHCKVRVCAEGDSDSSASNTPQSKVRQEAIRRATDGQSSSANEASGDHLRISPTRHEQYFVPRMDCLSILASGSNTTGTKIRKEKEIFHSDAEMFKPENRLQTNYGRGMLEVINKHFTYLPPVETVSKY